MSNRARSAMDSPFHNGWFLYKDASKAIEIVQHRFLLLLYVVQSLLINQCFTSCLVFWVFKVYLFVCQHSGTFNKFFMMTLRSLLFHTSWQNLFISWLIGCVKHKKLYIREIHVCKIWRHFRGFKWSRVN